jgi:uncharacterized protein YuzE
MKIKYDKEVDVMYIRFTDKDIDHSEETSSGIVVDYDENGNMVGIELLQISKRTNTVIGDQ